LIYLKHSDSFLQDALTDLTGDAERLPVEGHHGTWLGHKVCKETRIVLSFSLLVIGKTATKKQPKLLELLRVFYDCSEMAMRCKNK